MARNKKQVPENQQWKKAKWLGFVNVRLEQQEKESIKKNLLSEEAGYEFLMNAATDGYKCSISYSIPEDVYTVSMTGQYEGRPNAGVTMSIRHVELIVSVTALKWCHDSPGPGGEWTERYSMGGKDNW